MLKRWYFLLFLLIPLLAILPLLQSGYFSMHDVQHPVRLFLLDQGIKQGYVYPRWVNDLGFGYGYPLFNFYPPLIYYVAEIFVLLGFTIISSLKLMLISGFILAAVSSYLYARLLFSRKAALVVAILYTYTFYHAITIYVRGAFAEFYSMALFPLVAYFLHSLVIKPNWSKVLGLAISFALLFLCHPLIAFPALIFIGAYFLLAMVISQNWLISWLKMTAGLILGLSLSAFFWLPSLVEKNATLVNDILTKELYNYQLHFVYPQQLYFSPWGFGGSTAGMADGISYQIGKYYLLLVFLSLLLSGIYFWTRKNTKFLITVLFLFALLLFSYFMTLPYSAFIWDRIKYLWYLQFPWRFLTFASFYLSLVAGLVFYLGPKIFKNKLVKYCLNTGLTILLLLLVLKYSQLFRPQNMIKTENEKLTNQYQRQWVISRTSFEFVPQGVATKKNEFGVTTLAIEKADLPKKSYRIIAGQAQVKVKANKFQNKLFQIDAKTPITFQLNTYHFPGWQAFLDGWPLTISDNNSLKLIRVALTPGQHQLVFRFANTPVRKLGNWLTLSTLVFLISMAVVQVKKRQMSS